jgi:AcrR family transcriptional regulator
MSTPAFQRKDPAERREQILRGARRLFAEKTYSSVGTVEIAEATGVTWGLIAHYFGGKRGLYLAVARSLVEWPALPFDIGTGSLDQRIAAFSEWILGVIERNTETWLAATAGWDAGRDPELAEILDAARDVVLERMLDVLGADAPSISPDVLRAVGRVYLTMVETATREWLDRGRLTRGQVVELTERAFTMLMTDLAPALADVT